MSIVMDRPRGDPRVGFTALNSRLDYAVHISDGCRRTAVLVAPMFTLHVDGCRFVDLTDCCRDWNFDVICVGSLRFLLDLRPRVL